MKKSALVSLVLLGIMLLSPVALGTVYVPPGPAKSMDAWIDPHLYVIDVESCNMIGWKYSDGPMYYPVMNQFTGPCWATSPQIHKNLPWIEGETDIPYGNEVMVLGYIPMVTVSPNMVPPPVTLKITWNGIPYLVTLETENIVGYDWPPKLYPEISTTYPFAWPQESPYKDALYNIWIGDGADLMENIGYSVPSWWYETFYGYLNGYWFWYVFHPNVGDWIAYNCEGHTKFPPTYDITALFECGTSQVWFPHVCFDVSLLEVHKMVTVLEWYDDGSALMSDTVIVKNVGEETASSLDFVQTFPQDYKHYIVPLWNAQASIWSEDGRKINFRPLPDFGPDFPYDFQAPFDYLDPGETLTVTMDLKWVNLDNWQGSVVFDCLISAYQIPCWKEPIGLHSVTIGNPEGSSDYLWGGWFLDSYDHQGRFYLTWHWPVQLPWLREELKHPAPRMTLIGPEDLNADKVINEKDVGLVRQAIIGLISFNAKMDINGNHKVDTEDLAAYKSVVKG